MFGKRGRVFWRFFSGAGFSPAPASSPAAFLPNKHSLMYSSTRFLRFPSAHAPTMSILPSQDFFDDFVHFIFISVASSLFVRDHFTALGSSKPCGRVPNSTQKKAPKKSVPVIKVFGLHFAESFGQPFSKGCSFKRQSLLSPSAGGEMFSALFFGQSPFFCACYVKRKGVKGCCMTSRQRYFIIVTLSSPLSPQ